MALPQLVDAIGPALDPVDAIVLAPGRDIEPHRYGQDPHALLAATEPQRDAFELTLVGAALERELPILGMCRGVQVLNVALGGTLVQDVSLVAAGHPSDPGWSRWKEVEAASVAGLPVPAHPRHEISISPDTLLARALGTTTIEVSSFHHQATDQVGTVWKLWPGAPTMGCRRRSSCPDGRSWPSSGSSRRNGAWTRGSRRCSTGSWAPLAPKEL